MIAIESTITEDGLLFLGMDIPEVLKQIHSEKYNDITRNMTIEEEKAYNLGVKNIISLLEQLLNHDEIATEDGEVDYIVHIPGRNTSEYIYDDLFEMI